VISLNWQFFRSFTAIVVRKESSEPKMYFVSVMTREAKKAKDFSDGKCKCSLHGVCIVVDDGGFRDCNDTSPFGCEAVDTWCALFCY